MTDATRIVGTILAAPLLALAAVACSQGEPTNGGLTSFGSPGYGPVDGGSVADDGETGGSDDEDDEDDEESGDDPPDDPPTDDPNSSADETGGDPPPPSDTGDDGMDPPPDPPPGGGGTQPNVGMYAHCTETDLSSCGALGCMYVDLPGGQDGFCSSVGCTNPAVDCDPAPAGTTVTPICMPVGMDTTCALDCTNTTCPSPMQCIVLALDEAGTMTATVCI